jgi:hypothetical protein
VPRGGDEMQRDLRFYDSDSGDPKYEGFIIAHLCHALAPLWLSQLQLFLPGLRPFLNQQSLPEWFLPYRTLASFSAMLCLADAGYDKERVAAIRDRTLEAADDLIPSWSQRLGDLAKICDRCQHLGGDVDLAAGEYVFMSAVEQPSPPELEEDVKLLIGPPRLAFTSWFGRDDSTGGEPGKLLLLNPEKYPHGSGESP